MCEELGCIPQQILWINSILNFQEKCDDLIKLINAKQNNHRNLPIITLTIIRINTSPIIANMLDMFNHNMKFQDVDLCSTSEGSDDIHMRGLVKTIPSWGPSPSSLTPSLIFSWTILVDLEYAIMDGTTQACSGHGLEGLLCTPPFRLARTRLGNGRRLPGRRRAGLFVQLRKRTLEIEYAIMDGVTQACRCHGLEGLLCMLRRVSIPLPNQ